MLCAALTGITPEVIQDLKRGKPRTLELQSTHNIIALADVDLGAHIFISSVDIEDLSVGDAGIVVEVLGISIMMKRMIGFSHGLHYEERERMSARIKVKSCGASTVKAIYNEGFVKPTTVEVLRCAGYHAG
ncbi:MAG: DUF473 domain-containing protein [Methanomicrobiales archaeon]|jgi:hypothetical protein|nr:DUF473 domain-containing protein [Methanomicrobiales archaeon]